MTKAELIRELQVATRECERLAADIIAQRELMERLLDSLDALNDKCRGHIDRLAAMPWPEDYDLDDAPEGVDLDDADWWKNGDAPPI